MCNIKYVVISIFLLMLSSCALVTWEKLDVSCSVAHDQDYFNGETVGISFSVEPKKQSVESSIQVKNAAKIVPVEYAWNGSTVCLKPELPWKKGLEYQISLKGSVQMADGRVYSVHFERNFIYGQPGNQLRLESVVPEQTQILQAEPIMLTFNKPVQVVSFTETFSITPFLDKHIDFSSEGKIVTITPKSPWKSNTVYVWKLSDVLSVDGYVLDKEYGGQFFSTVDTQLPSVNKICPVISDAAGTVWNEGIPLDGGLREKQPIGFIFSKPMDLKTVEAGVSFSPSIKGYFKADLSDPCRFIFFPQEQYKLKKRYQITVARSVKDLSGLELYEQYSTFFTSANNYILVDSVTLDSAPAITTFPDETCSHTMSTVGTDVVLQVRVMFSTAIDISLRKNAVDAISLAPYFPATAVYPVLQSVSWNAAGTGVVLYWSNFSVSSANITNYYKLSVRGGTNGVKNDSGEIMERDIWVIFSALS